MASSGLTREQIAEFETVQSQLKGLYDEVRSLASKKPNDALNKFKLGVANGLLRRTNRLLEPKIALDGFGQFSDDAVPTNSDVLVVFSQYLAFLEKMRADNIIYNNGWWYWRIDGEKSDIRTSSPRKLDE